ncbi:MAG: acyl-CoA thioesterase domain-containing protein [Actinomycetota bacterium]
MTDPAQRLLRRLDLERGADDGAVTWHGQAGEGALNMNDAIYGGMVLAQTIVAAGRTVPERSVHSLSQMFLRAGRADVPLAYRCATLYAGRRYSMLDVKVLQEDEVISHAQVGLTGGADGPDRQDGPTASRVAIDETVDRDVLFARKRAGDQPVEVRVLADRATDPTPSLETYVKPNGALPEDPLMHQAFLAWVSDRGFMRTAWKPHDDESDYRGATLDHSIWFHRPVVFDDWHMYAMHSPSIADGRGLILGSVYDAGGIHVASTAQQGNYRPI